MVNFRGQLLPPWRPAPETIGQLFASRYRIIHKVADGATGAVFRAEDIGTRESVAVRLFRPELSQAPGLVEAFQARIRERLEIAAEEPGALPSFVDVADIGKTAEGLVFIVMPYIVGDRLGDLLGRSGPLPWVQARSLFLRLCHALADYHRHGRVHGTLELRKCWLTEDLGVMLLDDGVDTFLGDDVSLSSAPYCSPERAGGEAVGPAADVYALGVIFYELLTARVPFEDSSAKRTLAMHMLSPVPPPREVAPTAGIPEEVEALILQALAKSPEERFGSMEELAAAIEGAAAPSIEKGVGLGAPPAASPVVAVGLAAEPAGAVRRAKVHELEGFLDPPNAVVPQSEAPPTVRVVDGLEERVATTSERTMLLPVGGARERSQGAVIPSLTTPSPVSEPAGASDSAAVASDSAAGAGDSAAVASDPGAGDPAAGASDSTGAAHEPTLIGLILPPLVNPGSLSSGSSSVAAAVAASLRVHGPGLEAPNGAKRTHFSAPGADPTDGPTETAVAAEAVSDSDQGAAAEGPDSSEAAPAELPRAEASSSSTSGERPVDGASTSGSRRRRAGPHASASASMSMRRVIDLHPGSSGSMRGRFDEELHPSSSGSMRTGASASAGASGSRRVVNLVDVRAPSDSMTEGWSPAAESTSRGRAVGDGAGSSPSLSDDEFLDSGARLAARGDPQETTIQAPISGDDTLSASGIRPGPSRGAISWALGGIGAILAGSVAVALLSPPEAPSEAPAVEERIIAPAVIPVAAEVEEASDEVLAADDAPEAEAEEEAPAVKKRSRRSKARSSKKSKRSAKSKKSKKAAKVVAGPEEEEDDLLTQVESYMREKKEREAKQAAAVSRSKAESKPAASPADQAAAKEQLEKARTAYKNGKFPAAYSLASQSVGLHRSTDALELMALASCARGDGDRARQVHGKIAVSRRGAIEARCREAGIKL